MNAKYEELDIKIVKSLHLMYLESNRRGRHKASLQMCNNYYEVEKKKNLGAYENNWEPCLALV